MAGRIIIPGGAGYLGTVLARFFAEQGQDVVILSRKPAATRNGVTVLRWDGITLGDWAAAFDGAAAVVNLAGRSVNCRYSSANRQQIYESRLKSTKVLGEAISRSKNPPAVWINSSSATIYRHAEDRPMDEATGELGTGFSVDVCQKWEAELHAARTPHTRRAALRSTMVFGPTPGGAFDIFHRLARWGLAGTQGPGSQFVSWIHEADFARAVAWIIEHPPLDGPVNCAGPHPLRNQDFLRELRHACNRRIGLPATRWMLELGAICLRTETELILKSRRVIPGKLLASGFEFWYPTWPEAVRAIVRSGLDLSPAPKPAVGDGGNVSPSGHSSPDGAVACNR